MTTQKEKSGTTNYTTPHISIQQKEHTVQSEIASNIKNDGHNVQTPTQTQAIQTQGIQIQIQSPTNDKPQRISFSPMLKKMYPKRQHSVVRILTNRRSLFAYILRLGITIATLFFILLTFLYCYAQITELDVSNLWCHNKYTLTEIREHSKNNHLPFGDEQSCYIITDKPALNYQNLKSVNGIYGSSYNITGFLFLFFFVSKF